MQLKQFSRTPVKWVKKILLLNTLNIIFLEVCNICKWYILLTLVNIDVLYIALVKCIMYWRVGNVNEIYYVQYIHYWRVGKFGKMQTA